MEISNTPDKEFKVMVIKIQELRKERMKSVRMSTEIKNIKKNQSDMKNLKTKTKKYTRENQQQIRRVVEDQISNLEERIMESNKTKEQK